jgi:hypothetical protein
MATATAARSKSKAARRQELCAALEQALTEVDADERIGPLISATRLRMRFEFTDLDMALNVAAGEGDHNLSWSFADHPRWPPKLVLRMTSQVANRYLQGRESLAIAIARGEVKFDGESRVALLYLPAARLISDRYKRIVESKYPDLVAA